MPDTDFFKTKPFEHQSEALHVGWNLPEFGYFMEMGTGKSKVLIDNAAYLYAAGRITSLVIVAPKGVYRNWVLKEIPIHMPDNVPRQMATWRSSMNKAQQKKNVRSC